jgi:hypothetical protein
MESESRFRQMDDQLVKICNRVTDGVFLLLSKAADVASTPREIDA